MNSELSDLIRRLTTVECVARSDQSVSWHAYREAERIRDLSLLEDLETLANTSESKDERKAAYFILGALGTNTSNVHCALVLTERLRHEKDKYVLAVALDALAKMDKPCDFPLEAIFERLSEERWLVRHAAIRALQKTDSAVVEEQLLKHLALTGEPHDMVYCHATLGNVGSANSLPALERNLTSRKRDVKASAAFAIRAIKARVELQ
jgi:HEAT repeat protein